MYILTPKAIELLKGRGKDKVKLRRKIAAVMGRGEEAVKSSLKKNMGKLIAEHYDGFNTLIDETNMDTKSLRQLSPEFEQHPSTKPLLKQMHTDETYDGNWYPDNN